MPYKNKQEQLARQRERYAAEPEKYRRYLRKYYKNNKPAFKARQQKVKVEVLTHYGPNKKLQCTWPECIVSDPDLLTLDHIDNTGYKSLRRGISIYYKVRREGFPSGFQTLCWNHQWKKEILRREREGRGHAVPN